MAACCAQEEKVEKPVRLFNYAATGQRAPEYKQMPDCDDSKLSLEEYVDSNRKMMERQMAMMGTIPMFAEAMKNVEVTKISVDRSDICDADTTVYCLRPKGLPEKDCAAMIFAHGGPGVAGTAAQFNPMYAFAAMNYKVIGFNVDFRLPPEGGNKGSSDIYATLKHVYDNADKYGVDKKKIGMEGNGVGVHHMLNACNLMAQKNDTGMCKMMISEIGFFPSHVVFTPKKDLEMDEEKAGVGKFDHTLKAMAGDDFKSFKDDKNPMLFPDYAEDKVLEKYPPVAFFSPEFCFFHTATKTFSDRLDKVGKLLEFRLIRGLGHMYAMAQSKEVGEVFRDRVITVNAYLKQ